MSLPEPRDYSAFNQPNSNHLDPLSMTHETIDNQQVCDWQDQLLPVATILQEEDVTLLRQQLEAAHQLLLYRQNLVDSLTEQLVSDQTHLVQVERELEEAQLECTRQSEKVDDVQSVCQDLRSQLRRQQQRIGEYKQILKQSSQLPRSAEQLAPHQGFVPLDYDSLAGSSAKNETPKSEPVAPWSTRESTDLNGPLAIYRKLTAMTMATAAARSPQRRSELVSANYDLKPGEHRIELPSFT